MVYVHLRSSFLPAPVNDVELGEMSVCGPQIRFTYLDGKLLQIILGLENKSGARSQHYYRHMYKFWLWPSPNGVNRFHQNNLIKLQVK